MSKVIDRKRIASLTVFVVGILSVVYYIAFGEKVEFDSDFTDTILWAEAMITGNGLFDKTMAYAYTLPFGGSLLMAPFVAVFGVGYKAHALGFVLFLAIFAFSLYKLFRAMEFSDNMSLICTGIVLLLSLPTKNTRMIMWGHIIHYSLGLLFVIIALSVYSKISIDSEHLFSEKKNIVWIAVLSILTMLFLSNGLTIVLFFAIPFFGATIVERFIDTGDELFCKRNINTLIIAIVSMIAGMAGFVISKILQRGVNTVYDDMFKEIQSWQNWVWDFEDRIRCMLVVCAGGLSSDIAMESFTGIKVLYMALFGFAVMIVPFIALASYKKIQNRVIRLFIISYIILLSSTLFIYDFSMARGTAHRMVGIYMTAAIVVVTYTAWLIKNKELSRFGLLLSVILIGAAGCSILSVAALRGENRFENLAKVLEENDLHYGYAEYWSAQVTTVLSDSKIQVCPIDVSEEGEISKRLYNIRPQQFDSKEGVDRYFAFLSAWEYETLSDSIVKDAIDVIEFDNDGYIVVFDHNIF